MHHLRLLCSGLMVLSTLSVIWAGLLLPPPFWILKYGVSPSCEPEGEDNVAGVKFVVIGPGIARIGSSWAADNGVQGASQGNLLGRLLHPLGVDLGEAAIPSGEMPVHWVEFPVGFALAKTEITNAQYEAWKAGSIRGKHSPDDRDPVVNVSWDDAKGYCDWLSRKSGRLIRLPSESEWEAACRAGSLREYCFGDNDELLGDYAWYTRNSEGNGAQEVATKKANAWGFFDLHGNVWEWCEDSWHASYLLREAVPSRDGISVERMVSRSPTNGSAWLGDSVSSDRVARGGCWFYNIIHLGCRSAGRVYWGSGDRNEVLGFRPALGE